MTPLADLETEIVGAPDGLHVAPKSVEDVARVLKLATTEHIPVRVWGNGTRQKLGNHPPKGIVMSTGNLDGVEAWEPDDLTMVVGAGAKIGEIEDLLGGRSQTAVLPETSRDSTVGGVIATGASSLRRGRLLGIRERILEITSVTGDGRIVRSGGRVVKNVSGFDLHRAAVGAFGSLGVVVSVCLKLWPVPPSAMTIHLDEPEQVESVNRPLAALEDDSGWSVFLWGTEQEVESIGGRLGGTRRFGLQWPSDPAGRFRWSLRVPPALTAKGVCQARPWSFLAIHGVGEIRLASETVDGAVPLREWASSVGGALVLTDYPGDQPPIEPWGAVPQTVELQRRLIAEFDPARIVNPGRLPGSL